MYFVPGGRIGFLCPEVKPWSNTWHLHSTDQTLQVQVREALRINEDWDNRMWNPIGHGLIAEGLLSPGIEHRHFRNRRFDDNDLHYRADLHVFRDARWIGQIDISTSTLGSPILAAASSQVARWRDTIATLTASLALRPSPSVSQALVELRVNVPLEGLNPRFVGDQLVLSLVPSATPYEASGVSGSHISLTQLTLLLPGPPDQVEQARNEAFKIYSELPGSRVIAGGHCRGVALRENQHSDGGAATTVMVFGRTRELQVAASYSSADRRQMLRALERVVTSLELPD